MDVLRSSPAGAAEARSAIFREVFTHLRDGWNVTTHISATFAARRTSVTAQQAVAAVVEEAVRGGALEVLPYTTDVRLPARQALETILAEQLADRWREFARLERVGSQALDLLRENAPLAVQLDASAAIYTVLACAVPSAICADVRDVIPRVLAETTLGAGTHSPARVVAAVAAMRNFPGTLDDLVDASLGVLAAAP